MDITVKEGGLARRLAPIDKLKINTTDNKQSTWVPADKSNTGVLHAKTAGKLKENIWIAQYSQASSQEQ